ncbi:MAG: hypothetical protein P4N41_24270 [Negativicutes bacterium]|nr:hypothetical protein [Negativicutes bacterium]
MLTGIILFILSALLVAFFVIYKRDMLAKMFSLHASIPAGQLQAQLEQTGDAVIRQLESHIAHLELLLEEADGKIAQLDQKLRAADCVLAELEAPITQAQQPPARPKVVDLRLPAEPQLLMGNAAHSHSALVAENTMIKENKDNLSGDKRRQIMSMANQGYSVTEIAKTTGLGKGEIMLLLQLNRK